MRAKVLTYSVNTGGQWIRTPNSSRSFMSFKSYQAGLRYLSTNPKRGQMDVRGFNSRGRSVRECVAYWKAGRIVLQPLNSTQA